MGSIQKLKQYDVETYLALEPHAEIRHELVEGTLYDMVGSSMIHNQIALDCAYLLKNQLEKPCHVFVSDMKVRVRDNFYYPDVVISCEPIVPDQYFLTSPVVIIEILSKSTEGRDRVEKSNAYRRLASLQAYILLAQDQPHAEVLRRHDQEWTVETYSTGETITLNELKVNLPIDTIFTSVVSG